MSKSKNLNRKLRHDPYIGATPDLCAKCRGHQEVLIPTKIPNLAQIFRKFFQQQLKKKVEIFYKNVNI